MTAIKKTLCLTVCALLTLLLSACMFNSSPEEMYELPHIPEEYAALQEKIDELVTAGAEYAAPISGTNIQSVQLVDLDGDGTEEAVAFFRNSTNTPEDLHLPLRP